MLVLEAARRARGARRAVEDVFFRLRRPPRTMFLASSALRRFSRRVIPGEEENDEAGEELDR